jgi:hypothetical protein
MTRKNAALLRQTIRQRADRLGVSEEDVVANGSGEPQFLKAARQSSGRPGRAKEVLHDDLLRLDACEYPTRDCMMPYELAEFELTGLSGLAKERLEHCRDCPFCAILMISLKPNQEKIRELVRNAQRCMAASARP